MAPPMAEVVALDAPPAAALFVLDTLQSAGFEAYCVGGCVRDRLLGRPVGDWDLTTDARPEQVVALFPRVIPTGMAHGTVTVVVDHLNIEVTTYRVELGYTDGRRPDGVAFTEHLALDLERRDFTMNAMAWDPRRGLLVDLHGGRADLAARRVRAVGEAEVRFREDGLRALRAVRFGAVLGLEIEGETWAAIGRTLEVFAKVSAERIQVELFKTLGSPRPGWGAARLAESGLLGVFLPDYPLGVMAEVASSLDRAERDAAVRLALLLAPLGPRLEGALDALRVSGQTRQAVLHLVGTTSLPAAEARSHAAVRRLAAAIGRERLDATLAYHLARGTPGWGDLESRLAAAGARTSPLTPRELALTGRDVMSILGLAPSRAVGLVVDALMGRVLDEPELNTREALAGLLPAVYAGVMADARPGGTS